MTITVDLNVVLDVVQRREPHYAAFAAVLSLVGSPVPAVTPEEFLAGEGAFRER